jgi:hypothetical protein
MISEAEFSLCRTVINMVMIKLVEHFGSSNFFTSVVYADKIASQATYLLSALSESYAFPCLISVPFSKWTILLHL